MNTIAKKLLEAYLFEKKFPKVDLSKQPEWKKVRSCFISVFDEGQCVGSVGRAHPSKKNMFEELCENIKELLKDPRFESYADNPEKARKLIVRFDILNPEKRRMIDSPDQIDIVSEGVVLLMQSEEKISIILPNIFPDARNGQDIFERACKKVGIKPHGLDPESYILYALGTDTFE